MLRQNRQLTYPLSPNSSTYNEDHPKYSGMAGTCYFLTINPTVLFFLV
jgi:hypothetical protein